LHRQQIKRILGLKKTFSVEKSVWPLPRATLKAASHSLAQIDQLETQLIPEIQQYLLVIDARYLVATGEHEAALTAYNVPRLMSMTKASH